MRLNWKLQLQYPLQFLSFNILIAFEFCCWSSAELRTQIMSASLLSDMESFKAANPNGKLEDFIRWYSPRDWIEDDNVKMDGMCIFE